MTISQLRSRIDVLDELILHLLNQRAAAAQQIGRLKKQERLEVEDAGREAAVLAHVVDQNQGPLTADQLTLIFQHIMAGCRDLQR